MSLLRDLRADRRRRQPSRHHADAELHASYRERLRDNRDPAQIEPLRRRRSAAAPSGRATSAFRTLGWVVTHEDITERSRNASTRARTPAEHAVRGRGQQHVAGPLHVRCATGVWSSATALRRPLRPAARAGAAREPRSSDILAYRVEHGIHPVGGAEAYFERPPRPGRRRQARRRHRRIQDGRIISILHHPMADGGWVSTHQDITEQRADRGAHPPPRPPRRADRPAQPH